MPTNEDETRSTNSPTDPVTPPPAADGESERMGRIKAERLRALEQEHEQAQDIQDELRAKRAESPVPYNVGPTRKTDTPAETAERDRIRREAEKQAGLDSVAIGPQPADTDRDGRPGGTRGVPVALLALIPVLLILALPILFGQVSNLHSREPGAYGPDGTLYVAAAPGEGGGLKATLLWNAPTFAPLKIQGAKRDSAFANSATIHAAAATPGGETAPQQIAVAPLMGTGPSVNVVLVPTNPDTNLLVGGASPGGEDGQYVLNIGPHGARIAFTNDARGEIPLRLRIVGRPDAKNFILVGEDGGNRADAFTAVPGQPYVLPVEATEGGKPQDKLLLVTGDARHPLITILLRRTEVDGGDRLIDMLVNGDINGALATATNPKDPGALAVRAYVLKSRQQPGKPDPAADRALEDAARALELSQDATPRTKALVRRAMSREAELQGKADRAAQYKAEAAALAPDVAKLP